MNAEEKKAREETEKEKEEEDIKEEVVKEEAVKKIKTPVDSFIKLSMGIGILLVSLSISYYFLFFLPSREKARNENLEKCLSVVNSNYEKAWDRNCEQLLRNENCTLPLPVAESLDKYYREQKEDCFKNYPGKK
jgi:hypothetical protein